MIKHRLLIYLVIASLSGSIIFLIKTGAAPGFSLTLTFLLLLFSFGYFLSRIIKLKLDDFFSNLMVWLSLGFIWVFLLNFSAIFLKINVSALVIVYLISWAILLLTSLILDLFYSKHEEPGEKISISKKEILDFLPLFILVGLVIAFIALKGSLFKGGDPSFHLSILRKVIGNQPLSFRNLGYIQAEAPHIAYGFPLWHITMGVLGKMLNLDIFTVWKFISVPLVSIALMIWYWLFRQIFPTKNLAILSLSLLIVFYWGPLLTYLPIPDTFCRLILWPLTFGLALKYIFDRNIGIKFLFTLSILLILMGVVHMTQYFYFLLTMIVFGLIFALVKIRQKDYWLYLKRIGAATFCNFLFFLPFAAVLEANNTLFRMLGKMINSENIEQLRYGSFERFNFYSKFAYLGLPLILLFIKKNSKVIFLGSIMLVTPIAYFSLLKPWLLKFPGFIFMDRLYGTLTWHFATLALLFCFVFLLFDRLITRLGKISVTLKYIVNIILALGLTFVIIGESQLHLILNLNKIIFSPATSSWVNNNFSWFIVIFIILMLIILIIQKILKYDFKILELKEYDNSFSVMCLTIFILLVFFMPAIADYKYTWQKDKIARATIRYDYAVAGESTVKFINENIPPKSVILTDPEANIVLPILVDQYMAYYPHTSRESVYLKTLFKYNKLDSERMNLITENPPDYVLIRANKSKNAFWETRPEIFEKIFIGKNNVLYKVNKEALPEKKSDLK